MLFRSGEVVRPAKGFRLIITANTNGQGDDFGNFAGTLVLNSAYRDRFVFRYVDYPKPEDELKLMNSVLNHVGESVRKVVFPKMIEVANVVRKRYVSGGNEDPLPVTFSTRTLIRWAQMAWYYRPMAKDPDAKEDPILHALDHALAGGCDPVTREALREITQRVIDVKKIGRAHV